MPLGCLAGSSSAVSACAASRAASVTALASSIASVADTAGFVLM